MELDQIVAETLPPEGCWLRELQEAIAEEGGVDADTATKTTRRLKKKGVLVHERRGRKFWTSRGPAWDEWEPTVWEDVPVSLPTRGDDPDALSVPPSRRREADAAWLVWGRDVRKEEFRELIQAYKRGELEQVFIPAGSTAIAYKTAEGETVKMRRQA